MDKSATYRHSSGEKRGGGVQVGDETSEISWTGDVPVSERYQDPYFSLENGLRETEHVFIAGNNLADRLCPGFHIAELGFGTGLNLLVALQAARKADALPLRYTGFEAHPLSPDDMSQALAAFPELNANWLTEAWADGSSFQTPEVVGQVILGAAEDTLPRWDGQADAWFLDGFAPSRNPALWSSALMAEVARHTAPGGTFATYTAAGHVRRALGDAGFAVERQPGYGRKRHMSVGRLR